MRRRAEDKPCAYSLHPRLTRIGNPLWRRTAVPDKKQAPAKDNRLLVKLRPSSALRAAEARTNLQPLYDTPQPSATSAFGLDAAAPQWFLAEMPDGAAGPWDLAHARVAAQLGVSESDVVFAEPDLVHDVYQDTNEEEVGAGLAAADQCEANPQDGAHGKALGPDAFAWHLDNDHSQLGAARDAVEFKPPRTRIAHLDTGYYRAHETVPEHVLRPLERSFVEGDANRGSAEDPDNRVFLIDNSGHGTGTIGILAGGKAASHGGVYLGGAPGAEVLPLRVSDRVVLLKTSALARALDYAVEQQCDVATLSMGGTPSQAWAEAVDKAYMAGLCLCAAAGNHIGFTPPQTLVYPARYSRVIAVCGVMADGRPYADLKGTALEGSFGPDSAMKAAIAAYTPNIPWPRFMCGTVIRLNGEGTSAATPQVAAAAAIYFEKYKHELPRDWRRVEAVRNALFASAKMKADRKHFGNGVLQARAALNVRPVFPRDPSPKSDNSFSLFRVITGLGVVEPPPREQMFNLELSQRWMLNPELQEIVPDPAASARLDDETLRRFMEALIEDDGASLALRKHVATRYPVAARAPRPGRSTRPPPPRAGRRGPRRGQPAVPPADGLRRRHEDHRPLRARARSPRPLAPEAEREEPARRQRLHRSTHRAPARAPPGQRLLQPARGRAPVRLLRGRGGRPRRPHARQPRLLLPLARHHRPRDDARHPRRHAPPLQRADQPGRARAPRRLRRHRRADAALHHPRSARAGDRQDARRHRGRVHARPARRPVRSRDGRARRAAQRHRASGGRRLEEDHAQPRRLAEASDAARARGRPRRRGLRRLHRHLQVAHRRPAPHLHGRHRRAADRGHPPRPRPPPRGRGGQVRQPRPQHVHPRARLPAARGRDLLRVPARPHHRRLRPRHGRPPQLPRRLRRSLPPPRHLPRRHQRADGRHSAYALRGHAALAGLRHGAVPAPRADPDRRAVQGRARRAPAVRRGVHLPQRPGGAVQRDAEAAGHTSQAARRRLQGRARLRRGAGARPREAVRGSRAAP